ncbi:phage minor capsid protein [Chryseomicrobium palamuruense]
MSNLDKLLAVFEETSSKLLDLVRSLLGFSGNRLSRYLKEVENIASAMQEEAVILLLQVIEESYRQGSNEAINTLKMTGLENINAKLSIGVDRAAVQQIVDDAFYSILEATDFMTQDTKERIEVIVQEANRAAIVEGQSRRVATQKAIAEATDRGITGIIARNGARIPVEKYLAGTVQYYQRKAHVDGVLNRMTQNNLDLIYVNSVGITCSKCAQYQGRVYSVSGNDKRFPQLIERPPYHAHCVHSAYPWIEEYEDVEEVQRMLVDSNRPFEDNRAERHIQRYNELQKEKSKKNEVRKQWIRYKSRMPDLPDLRSFASHKARNTQKYQDWMEEYRKFGEIARES